MRANANSRCVKSNGTVARLQRALQLPFAVRIHDVAFGHADIADDHGEQIVEVVRDTAGQLPQALHLLALVELFLCILALLGLSLPSGNGTTFFPCPPQRKTQRRHDPRRRADGHQPVEHDIAIPGRKDGQPVEAKGDIGRIMRDLLEHRDTITAFAVKIRCDDPGAGLVEFADQ